MTVQELIDELEKIQDKTKPILISTGTCEPERVWQDTIGELRHVVIMTK